MASGVKVAEEAKETYDNIKMKTKDADGNKLLYVIFHIVDKREIQVLRKVRENEGDYESFCAELPADDCRYCLYSLEYELPKGADGSGGKRDKLMFIFWSPDDAKVGSKMLYASSKAELRNMFRGIVDHQATDREEIDYQAVLNTAMTKK